MDLVTGAVIAFATGLVSILPHMRCEFSIMCFRRASPENVAAAFVLRHMTFPVAQGNIANDNGFVLDPSFIQLTGLANRAVMPCLIKSVMVAGSSHRSAHEHDHSQHKQQCAGADMEQPGMVPLFHM